MDGGSIKTAQLFPEQIFVLETKPQAPHTEIHIQAVPALLIDTNVNGAKRDGRALRGFQYKRIVRNQRLLVRLLAFAKEIELGAIQTDKFTSQGRRRADLFTEIDVGAERNLYRIFGHCGGGNGGAYLFL